MFLFGDGSSGLRVSLLSLQLSSSRCQSVHGATKLEPRRLKLGTAVDFGRICFGNSALRLGNTESAWRLKAAVATLLR